MSSFSEERSHCADHKGLTPFSPQGWVIQGWELWVGGHCGPITTWLYTGSLAAVLKLPSCVWHTGGITSVLPCLQELGEDRMKGGLLSDLLCAFKLRENFQDTGH